MTNAGDLRSLLIRNVDAIALERQERPPLYDTRCGRLSAGTAAKKLGAGYDILAPGKRGCPYHLHHAEEEMFVVLEGAGTLRVAGEMLAIRAGDVIMTPPGPEYPHQIIDTSDAPLRYAAYSRPFDAIGRSETSLDYWEGEP